MRRALQMQPRRQGSAAQPGSGELLRSAQRHTPVAAAVVMQQQQQQQGAKPVGAPSARGRLAASQAHTSAGSRILHPTITMSAAAAATTAAAATAEVRHHSPVTAAQQQQQQHQRTPTLPAAVAAVGWRVPYGGHLWACKAGQQLLLW
jgi:hypothetical protein